MPRRLSLIGMSLLAALSLQAQGTVSFSRDIQPILESSCWKCHGAAVQLSKLDLRSREAALKGGVHGPSIVPGKPDASKLFRMVAGLDKPSMPMDGKLQPEQVQAFRKWIEDGAQWDAVTSSATKKAPAADLEGGSLPPDAKQYWAFQAPVRRPIPVTANERMSRHPVDAFVMQKLQERGLKPAPRADAITLVRRAYLDLIGLPPSPAEVAEFVNDKSADAWEKLIDRLLASPHYGERWGRHWLDVARYADSNGYEHDFDRPNAWRYRDYVIRSFNRDTPFNVFLREQIAGDELDWVTKDSLIATGFLRNYAKVGFREKDNPEFRYEYLDDMIATIGRGILGMTVQCARCHNHKFDPILQKDYYRLQASLFGYVEVDHPLTTPEERRLTNRRLAEVTARLNELRMTIRTLEQPYRAVLLAEKYKKFPANVQAAIATPEAERTPGQVLLANQVIRTVSAGSSEIDRHHEAGGSRSRRKDSRRSYCGSRRNGPRRFRWRWALPTATTALRPTVPAMSPLRARASSRRRPKEAFCTKARAGISAPPSYFLIRGDVNSRGSVMQPGFLTVATKGDATYRVAAGERTHVGPPARARRVARVQGQSADRASDGESHLAPSLRPRDRRDARQLRQDGRIADASGTARLAGAASFMDRGWSIKQMHRLLMTSEAYKMSSQFDRCANVGERSREQVRVALPDAPAGSRDRSRFDPGCQRRD